MIGVREQGIPTRQSTGVSAWMEADTGTQNKACAPSTGQSAEPKTRAAVQIQTNTATGDKSSFTSSHCRCGADAGKAALPPQFGSEAKLRDLNDHEKKCDVLLRTIKYKNIIRPDHTGRHTSHKVLINCDYRCLLLTSQV